MFDIPKIRLRLQLFLVACLLLCGVQFTFAQVSQGGTPFSFDATNATLLSAEVPQYSTPDPDLALLQAEDEEDKVYNVPRRFGYPFAVDLNLDNSGVWDVLPNGDRIWRMRINAKDAHTMNLNYSQFFMPEGASLYLYAIDKSFTLGAFTSVNNKSNGKFATGLMRTQEIVLEYHEPAAVAGEGQLAISSVVYGYRDLPMLTKDFGDSGPCNINTVCEITEGWEPQIDAVAMWLMADNTRWCTGTMINNTSQDCTPYFLTAHHCLPGGDSAGDEVSYIFMFDYESPTCSPSTDGPITNTVQGATIVANASQSDFCLMLLDDNPADYYNVFFAGWDRTDDPAQTATAISHPAGDVKKFAYAENPVFSSAWTGSGDTHWEATWDYGTTEGGSSGSGCFDEFGRLIGQLHGGGAACAGTEPNGDTDLYGKIYHSWDQVSATNPQQQLKSWLDPIDLGVDAIDGLYCSAAAPVAQFSVSPQILCLDLSEQVQFTDISALNPEEWQWIFPGGDPVISYDQNPLVTYTDVGTYDVTLIAYNEYGADTLVMENHITVVNGVNCPCFEPTAITTSDVSLSTATADWTPGNVGGGVSWSIEYGPAGFTPGTGTVFPAGSNTFTMVGLSANTSYEYYLTEICGEFGTSDPVGPTAFTTICSADDECTYTLNLDSPFFFGWSGYVELFNNGQSLGTFSINDDDSFEIDVCSNGTLEVFVDIGGFGGSEMEFELIGPDGETLYEDGPSPEGGFVFNTTTCPACDFPTAVEFDNITTTTIDISWEAGDAAASAWIIEYGEGAFPAGTGNTMNVADNSATLTGLTPNTIYTVFVAEICPDGQGEGNSSTYTFLTGCNTDPCGYELVLEDTYGDGWNGASLDVLINGMNFYNYTIPDGYDGDASFEICSDNEVSLNFNSGEYDNEVLYYLYDGDGNLVYESGENPTAGESWSGLSDCTDIGIEQTAEVSAINVYQEDHQLYISTTSTFNADQIQLFDARGALILQERIDPNANQHSINTQQLPAGLYLLHTTGLSTKVLITK